MNIKRNLLTGLGSALTLLVTLLSACGAPTESGGTNPLPTIAPTAATPTIPVALSSPLSEAILKNAKYELPDIGTVQLKEGKFEQKGGQGASQVDRGDLQRVVLGDLNGDGAQDAVVILAVNRGGSGVFVYTVVVVNQSGSPKQVAAEMLGDRVQIKALSITNGQLDIDFLGFGPKDPMCCPSQATTRAYRLQGNTLVKISDSSPATNTGKLTENMLKNAKYTLPDIGAVQLKDGDSEYKYGEGATQVNKVGYIQAVLSDLNGDKADDAVVILWANTGGSGTFIHLIAVANQNGAPQQVAAQLLGDRIKVQNLAVQNGQIVINVLSFGPSDPQCCPSQLVIRTYRLEGGALKVISEVKPTAGANASIVNAVWQWERFDDTAGMNSIKVSDPTQYTLQLLPDGTYQVKADCNLGNGKYVLDGSSLKLRPMAMTRAACAPDSLSDKYVARLGDVATLVLRDGKLYLNLKMDAGNMIFRQTGSNPSGALQSPSASDATQVIVFDPRSVKLDPSRKPLEATCAASEVVRRTGAYQCTTATGGNLDPCFVVEGNTLMCNPNPVTGSHSLATASLPLPKGGATQDEPAVFFLELASGYPPCAKRADLKKELAGQPVTYSCQAPGAWLLGNVDVAQSAWVVQYVTTDTQGAQVTFGPKTVKVVRAWVY